jgi:hypothetical protein
MIREFIIDFPQCLFYVLNVISLRYGNGSLPVLEFKAVFGLMLLIPDESFSTHISEMSIGKFISLGP